MKLDSDYMPILIVGQGLAGTWLSFQLFQAGIPFVVIDNNHFESASTIAAGLINPIVPKRLTKTWKFAELFPNYIPKVYREIELFIEDKIFYSEREISKLFFHQDNITAWEIAKSKDNDGILGAITSAQINTQLESHLGYADIKHSAWVDTPLLISKFKQKLLNLGLLIQDEFSYSKLIVDETLTYGNQNYKCIIFCEGSQIRLNPWFSKLPIIPTKGEEILIEAPYLNLSNIITSGLHIIPEGNNRYWVGSTFNWVDQTFLPTDSAKTDILKRFAKIYDKPFEIINHIAGIRPASKDRRPFVGFHPNLSKLGVINGLGTKGLLLAPLMAYYLLKYITSGTEIPSEVNIKRVMS